MRTIALLLIGWGTTALAQEPAPFLPPPLPLLNESPIFKLEAFPKSFVPMPGLHRIVFLHPTTKKPTEVTIDLPNGKPRVTTTRRTLTFDYGKTEITVRFYRDGGFRVDYD